MSVKMVTRSNLTRGLWGKTKLADSLHHMCGWGWGGKSNEEGGARRVMIEDSVGIRRAVARTRGWSRWQPWRIKTIHPRTTTLSPSLVLGRSAQYVWAQKRQCLASSGAKAEALSCEETCWRNSAHSGKENLLEHQIWSWETHDSYFNLKILLNVTKT